MQGTERWRDARSLRLRCTGLVRHRQSMFLAAFDVFVEAAAHSVSHHASMNTGNAAMLVKLE